MPGSSASPLALRARWVFPVDQPPLEGGIVTVASGRILAVGDSKSARPPQDLGDVALLPGLINAHTHLEFSLLDRPLGEPGLAFPAWIGRVVEYRKQRMKAMINETDGFARQHRLVAEAGLKELRAAGVVAVGEIAMPGWPRECFPTAGVDLTLFLELLGLDREKEARLLQQAQSFIAELQEAGATPRPGLSPHAPYTVGLELLRKACELSAKERIPVAMHLAESPEELELLAEQRGPLVEALQALGSWHPEALPRNLRPLDFLQTLATAHRVLVVHGNYLREDEIALVAAHHDRMSLIYCPRTHTYFGHQPYPLSAMLAAGARVAIGTDSRATNPNLSLWEELRHIAAHHPRVSPETILRLGTLSGAEALGLADKFGSITSGKLARLAVVPLTSTSGDPHELLFTSTASAKPLS